MLKNLLGIITLTTLFITCSTPKTVVQEKEVKKIVVEKTTPKPLPYTDMLAKKLRLHVEGQKLPLTLVTFTGTKTDLIGAKRLFEEYGNWQKALNITNSERPLLVWKNIPLLDNDFKTMTVISNGRSTNGKHQISFMIYDSHTKKDLLADDSTYKKPIVDKIIELLETNKPEDKTFEKKFWKEFYFIDIYEEK